MRILDEQVESYLRDLRPERSELMAEMEGVAERDSVPIVYWETGRFLAEGAQTDWNRDSLSAARTLNAELLRSDRWLACVLPVGDGIGFGARRSVP